MIRLGMTDCPSVRRLLESGQLALDYLEVHGPYLEAARQVMPARNMLLHNSLYQWSLAHPLGLAYMDAARLTRERLRLAASPWYSLHLGFSSAQVDFYDEAMQALTEVLPREVVLNRSCSVLQQLGQEIKMPLLVENLDYNPTGAYEYVCEPLFIKEVLEHTGTYLLLDLAHARVSAYAFGIRVEDYIDQLPLERVRQIHVNRPGWHNARLVDSHLELQEDDYVLLARVLEQTQPWAITLEYNRDECIIVEQIERLRAITQKNGDNSK